MNIWKINGSEQELVHAVYDILRLCGEDMYENQGLCIGGYRIRLSC